MNETESQRKILLNYFIYFLVFIITCFIGIINTFADTYTNIGYLSDKSQVQVAVTYNTGSGAPLTVNKDQVYNIPGISDLIISINNYNFSANTIYEIEINLPYSSFNNNLNSVTVTGGNSSGCTYISSRALDGHYPRVRFSCTNASNGLTIVYSNSNHQNIITSTSSTTGGSDFRWNYTYLILVNVSQDTTVIEQNNQIINQNNQIIEGQQNIINNQNQNTQDIINSNRVCSIEIIDEDDITDDRCYLNSSGALGCNQSGYGVTGYLEIGSYIKTLEYQSSSFANFCFYDENKELISCSLITNATANQNLSVPADAKYFRTTINTNSHKPKFEMEICKNGNQAVNDTNKGILGKIKELFSFFNNNDDADLTGLDNMVGWLPPGPVDSIINLPLAFFNALTNTLSGTCQDVSLTLPFVNQTLVLPCFDSYMSQYLTNFSTFWTLVGTILSIFILYYYLLSLYKWVDDTLTFRENNLPGYYDDNWGGGA